MKDSNFQWAALTNGERWRYHAYDYAFLRVQHGLQQQSYPLDPDGKWFHAQLVEAAECIYRPPAKPQAAPVRPADMQRDPDLAAQLQCQDRERDPLKFQVQVHGEWRTNGEPTPQMLAFMRCCARQVEANGKIFDHRSRRTFAPEARMRFQEIAEMHAALGVSAVPRPAYEDPEVLRQARIELGLEQPSSAVKG